MRSRLAGHHCPSEESHSDRGQRSQKPDEVLLPVHSNLWKDRLQMGLRGADLHFQRSGCAFQAVARPDGAGQPRFRVSQVVQAGEQLGLTLWRFARSCTTTATLTPTDASSSFKLSMGATKTA